MLLRKFTATVVPVAIALGLGAGTAHADPAMPVVHYVTKLVGNTVQTTLTGGSFRLAADQRTVDIRDADGNTVVTLPLSIRQNGTEYPLPHRISADSHELDLTAVKNAAAARPARAIPVASVTENQRALESFSSQFGIATAIGGFLGTALGALIGLTGIVSGPGVVASVLAGASLGAIIGTIVVGGPALVLAGIDLVDTLGAAPGTTKWNQ
ncbi:hypothetical protein [Nocardia miyunensis]|uniref:hypothetical protein n=1 Tax=Nocardia miyunensis TaxID=282684 RepID=UPI00082962C4|nr:hypothetical protein [Nocardia miyunensis]